jgi:hypothetical protein
MVLQKIKMFVKIFFKYCIMKISDALKLNLIIIHNLDTVHNLGSFLNDDFNASDCVHVSRGSIETTNIVSNIVIKTINDFKLYVLEQYDPNKNTKSEPKQKSTNQKQKSKMTPGRVW